MKPKRYLVGRQGEIWGTLVVGPVLVIQTDEEWRALLPSHCWHVDKRPYKKTYALTLGKIELFTTSIEYPTPRGQSSITKYRAPDCGKQAGVSARLGWRPDDMRALLQRSQTEESSNEASAKRKRLQRKSIQTQALSFVATMRGHANTSQDDDEAPPEHGLEDLHGPNFATTTHMSQGR